jgi:hypothetical protein
MGSDVIEVIDFEFFGLNFTFFYCTHKTENKQTEKTSEQINCETHCGFKAKTLMLTIELAASFVSSAIIPERFMVSLARVSGSLMM